MAVTDNITMKDVLNLKAVQKKLKLKFDPKRVREAVALSKNEEITDDDKVRALLNIPADVPVDEYLRAKLNASEIETMRKFTKTI